MSDSYSSDTYNSYQITSLRTEVASLDAKTSRLSNKIGSLSDAISSLESEQTSLESRISDLRVETRSSIDSISRSVNQFTTRTQQLQTRQKELADLMSRFSSETEHKISLLGEEFAEQHARLAKTEERIFAELKNLQKLIDVEMGDTKDLVQEQLTRTLDATKGGLKDVETLLQKNVEALRASLTEIVAEQNVIQSTIKQQNLVIESLATDTRSELSKLESRLHVQQIDTIKPSTSKNVTPRGATESSR